MKRNIGHSVSSGAGQSRVLTSLIILFLWAFPPLVLLTGCEVPGENQTPADKQSTEQSQPSTDDTTPPLIHSVVPEKSTDPFEAAANQLRADIEKSPKAAELYLRLALLNMAAGETSQALVPLGKASDLSPDAVEIRTAMALLKTATGNEKEALDNIEHVLRELRRRQDASLKSITLCQSIISYGVYVPRTNNEYAPGQRMLVYFEPRNFCCDKGQDGKYTIAVQEDVAIIRSDGKVAWKKENFATTTYHAAGYVTDLHLNVLLDLPADLSPGSYNLRIVLRDKLCSKEATAEVPFIVVRPVN